MTAEEKAADEAVDMTNCSLSKIILEHMDINKERDDRKKEEKEEQEEEFDTDDEVGNHLYFGRICNKDFSSRWRKMTKV